MKIADKETRGNCYKLSEKLDEIIRPLNAIILSGKKNLWLYDINSDLNPFNAVFHHISSTFHHINPILHHIFTTFIAQLDSK